MEKKKTQGWQLLVSNYRDLFQTLTSHYIFCFWINLHPKFNSVTVLLFCYFCCRLTWPKGQESSWGGMECVHSGSHPQSSDIQHNVSTAGWKSTWLCGESLTGTYTRTHTHTQPSIAHVLLFKLTSPLSPISHAFLYCGSVPDFMGTGPEWRMRIMSVHIVNQRLHKQQLPHIKLKHWKV